MDPDDILFVFMTSHGSSEHELVLDQHGIELPDLTARKLGELFQQLSARWKVVVIAACFSCGLIPHLENDYTLIMTAADHDRKLFGCTDDADMTYFGRALFEEALPRSGSFDEAFERARELVREWEDKKQSFRTADLAPEAHTRASFPLSGATGDFPPGAALAPPFQLTSV